MPRMHDRSSDKDSVGKELNERLDAVLEATVARQEKVDSLAALWREVRAENNFRKSLEALFSGD